MILQRVLTILMVMLLSHSFVMAAEKPEIFVQTGHAASITAMAVSRDGSLLLTGDYTGSIKLWNKSLKKEIRTLQGSNRKILSLAFSHDHHRVFSISEDKIQQWDIASGALEHSVEVGITGSFKAAAISSDSRYAVTADTSTIKLWDIEKASVIKKMQEYFVDSLVFSPDGRRFLASNTLSPVFSLWGVAQGKKLREFHGHTTPRSNFQLFNVPGRVSALAFSPDGRMILSGGTDSVVKLWDTETGKELKNLTGHTAAVVSAAFSSDGLYGVTASSGQQDKPATIKLWDLTTGTEIRSDEAVGGSFSFAAITPQNAEIVAVDGGKILRFWEYLSGKEIDWQFWYALDVNRVAFSPDGQFLMSGIVPSSFPAASDSHYFLWDLSSGSHSSMRSAASSFAFSPTGKQFLSGMTLFDTETGQETRRFSGHAAVSLEPPQGTGDLVKVHRPMDILAVGFSADAREALSWGGLPNYLLGSVEGEYLKRWDMQTGKPVRVFQGASLILNITSAAFSDDGRLALTVLSQNSMFGEGGKPLALWDTASGRALRSFGDPSKTIQHAILSPDGKRALSWDNLNDFTNSFTLWDSTTGKELRTFKGHGSLVNAAAFSKSGTSILSGSLDRTMKLWDLKSGKPIRTFRGHHVSVDAVAFSPDGMLAVSGGDASARIWKVATGEELARFISFLDGEWITITPEGYYAASGNGHKYLNIRFGNKVYGMEQFYDVFYRPDIVTAKLRGEPINRLVSLTIDEALKHPPPHVAFLPLPKETAASRLKVCYRVDSTGGGIGEVRLFQNGKLIKSDGYYREARNLQVAKPVALLARNSRALQDGMRALVVHQKVGSSPLSSPKKPDHIEECVEVEPISGDNEFSLAAFNADNTVQSYLENATVNAVIVPDAPELYILAVGIDQYRQSSISLKFAAKDARDFAGNLAERAASLFRPEHVHVLQLADATAGKAHILTTIDSLANQIKPADTFVFFTASHGVLLDNQYYMVTADFAGDLSQKSNLISSNELVMFSKKIKSLSQLFVFDTCHAGGVDSIISGLYDARMSVLAKKMGLHVFASAGSLETALDGYQGNGLFTHTLLEAMTPAGKRAAPAGNPVTIVSLGQFSKQRTMELSRLLGNLQTPHIIDFGRDRALFTSP